MILIFLYPFLIFIISNFLHKGIIYNFLTYDDFWNFWNFLTFPEKIISIISLIIICIMGFFSLPFLISLLIPGYNIINYYNNFLKEKENLKHLNFLLKTNYRIIEKRIKPITDNFNKDSNNIISNWKLHDINEDLTHISRHIKTIQLRYLNHLNFEERKTLDYILLRINDFNNSKPIIQPIHQTGNSVCYTGNSTLDFGCSMWLRNIPEFNYKLKEITFNYNFKLVDSK